MEDIDYQGAMFDAFWESLTEQEKQEYYGIREGNRTQERTS